MSLSKNINPSKISLSRDDTGTLLLLAAVIFGAWFRIMPVWLAGFPLNDGGMFYSMMKDLQANGFIPPTYTTYNNLNIPFAYPPLGLYVGAGISSLFGISGIEILRWLPAIINSFCVPVFYLLAKEITEDKLKGAVAALIFGFTPHLTNWLSAGGGLTRSFGTLFLILTILYAHRLFRSGDKKFIWATTFFGGLAILSHPEAGIYAISLAILAWFANSVSVKSTFHAILVAVGAAILAGWWYGWVVHTHGMESILSALQTGGHSPLSVLKMLNINFLTEEPYLSLLGATGVLGIIFLIISKRYFAPAMLLVIYLVQPRSAHTIANIPLAIASGVFVVVVLLPAIQRVDETLNTKRGLKIFLLLLAPYLFANSTFYALTLSQNHVSQGERQAMTWVKENTPEGSRFVTITGEGEAWCDSSGEWFPALAERHSLSTLQGREWLLGKSYNEFATHRSILHACINEDVACLERELDYFGTNADYVYVATKTPTKNCSAVTTSQTTPPVVLSLQKSPDYSIVYESPEVVIFEKK